LGLVILLSVLCTASLILNLLTLALASRVALDQRASASALIDGHNHVARLVGDLGEKLESAMDCLLILDATA
jgi:hypothetical protein